MTTDDNLKQIHAIHKNPSISELGKTGFLGCYADPNDPLNNIFNQLFPEVFSQDDSLDKINIKPKLMRKRMKRIKLSVLEDVYPEDFILELSQAIDNFINLAEEKAKEVGKENIFIELE